MICSDCDRPITTQRRRGLCSSCYQRHQRNGTLDTLPPSDRLTRTGTCSIPECNNPIEGRSWCRTHYRRWLRHGDPLIRGRPIRTIAEVFASHMLGDPPPALSPTEGCWDWNGSTISTGYGNFTAVVNGRKKQILATRASYEIFVGPIPEGLFILHSCDRPICVQPAHLRPGTQKENMQDALNRGRWRGNIRQR